MVRLPGQATIRLPEVDGQQLRSQLGLVHYPRHCHHQHSDDPHQNVQHEEHETDGGAAA